MVDLFCGLGGASAAMRARGWRVIGVDNRPELAPEICCDVTKLRWTLGPVDLLWASPPCVEFSKRDKRCWYPDAAEPSAALVAHALRLVMEIRPRWWIVENVRGAVPYLSHVLGAPVLSRPPLFLWGRAPCDLAERVPRLAGFKERLSRTSQDRRALRLRTDERRAQLRAVVPWVVSEAVALACEAAIREAEAAAGAS